MAGDARQQAAPDETLAMFVSSIQSVIREQINKDLASYIEEVRSYEREGGGDGSLVAFAVGAFPRGLQRDTKWTRICSKVRHHVMRTFFSQRLRAALTLTYFALASICSFSSFCASVANGSHGRRGKASIFRNQEYAGI